MMRALVLALIAVLAVVALAVSEHAQKPLAVTMHHADWQYPDENPDLLFAPCPTGPRNRPVFRSERKA